MGQGDNPSGWFNNWVSQGQIFGGYAQGAVNSIQDTLKGFAGGKYYDTNAQLLNPSIHPDNGVALDALMTYFGSGFSADNRSRILGRNELTGSKSPWLISGNVGLDFTPVYVLYTNDASTSESSFNLAIDMASEGGTTNGLTIPVNILINAALTAGAFLGARTKAAMDARGLVNDIDPSKGDLTDAQIKQLRDNRFGNFLSGDLLLTPDGFGSFTKNYTPSVPIINSGADVTVTMGLGATMAKTSVGWELTDPMGPKVIWPTKILGFDVSPKQTATATGVSFTSQVTDATDRATSLPNISTSTKFDFKGQLTNALTYLSNNRASLEKLGVVFPDKFDAVVANPGATFSPKPGVNLPALNFSNTVDDYLAVQAYLTKLFAGPLNVATVVNPWMAGNIDAAPWYVTSRSFRDDSNLLASATSAADVRSRIDVVTQQIANKAKTLGWFKASPYMDYLGVDKYERDELSGQAAGAQLGNVYNRNGWINYLYYTQSLANQLTTGGGSIYDSINKKGVGSNETLLFQIPTAPLAQAGSDGNADASYYAKAYGTAADRTDPKTGELSTIQDLVNNVAGPALSDQPHLSFAFDTIFGNSNLVSKEDFARRFPDLATLAIPGSPSGPTNLADYIFSEKPNALEASGQKDLTQSLLVAASGSQNPQSASVLDHIFSILWGGGNTSTPINYNQYEWRDAGSTDAKNTSTPYTPNKWGTSVLGNVLDKLSDWAKSSGLLGSSSNSGEVIPKTVELNAAYFKATADSVALRITDQGEADVSVGLFKLDATADPITGLVNGRQPSDSDYLANVAAGVSQWIDNPGKWNASLPGSGVKDQSLPVEIGQSYGIVIRNGSQFLTTFAGSNPSGASHASLLPTSDLMTGMNLSALAVTGTAQTIGFEDLCTSSDWDYNDLGVTFLSGANLVL
ncbi:MAG: hypothetical protein EBS30_11850 [Planctomycetes bacterium]|nr:hypothetical protein [Planctomycetota bacterium]